MIGCVIVSWQTPVSPCESLDNDNGFAHSVGDPRISDDLTRHLMEAKSTIFRKKQ